MSDMNINNIGNGGKAIQINADNIENLIFSGERKSCEDLVSGNITLNSVPRIEGFIGREEELKKLNELLNSERVVALVSGVGGIGKSSLALEYFRRNYLEDIEAKGNGDKGEDKKVKAVVYGYFNFVDLKGEDKSDIEKIVISTFINDIKEDIKEFARIRDKDDLLTKFSKIITCLTRIKAERKVLILDNLFALDDIKEFTKRIKVLLESNYKIILTTRESFEETFYKKLLIEALPKDKALELFKSIYPFEIEKGKEDGIQSEDEFNENVEKLLEIIGYNTLLIRLFAFTLKEFDSLTLKEIIEELEETTAFQLVKENETALRNDDRENFIYLNYLFEKQKLSEEEESLLKKLVLLPSAEYTLDTIFTFFERVKLKEFLDERDTRKKKKKRELERNLNKLANRGWLIKYKNIDGKNVYKLHQIIKDYLLDRGKVKIEDILTEIRNFTYQLQDNLSLVEERKKLFGNYAGIILTIYRVINILGNRNREDILKEEILEFLIKGGKVLIHLNLFEEAEKFFKLAEEIFKELEGKIEPEEDYLLYKANLYSGYGKLLSLKSEKKYLDKSLEKYYKALKARKELLKYATDEWSEKILKKNLASLYGAISQVYKEKGDKEKAVEYAEKSKNLTIEAYGEEHKETAKAYGNLATIYKSIGDDNKALEYALKNLELLKKAYGEEHKETAKAYGNLATIYKSIGNDNKALEYALKNLELLKKAYGEEHKETAKAYGNLATIYKSIGDDNKALEYQMKALEITKKAYGEEHKETAKAYGNLATIYKSIGDDNKALEYALKNLELLKKAYGEEHKETAKAYGNLATIYKSIGDDNNALEYQMKALEITKKAYGEEHKETAKAYGNLATIYKSIGDDNKALEYSEKALEITKKAYGEEHKETAKAYGNLATIYKSIGNDNNALEYSKKALEITKKAYGEEHKETAKAYGNLATIYKSIGNDNKALEYALKNLELLKKAYGEEHKETAKAYGNLATIYKSIGDDNKALEYQMKALEITKKAYGEEHKETAKAYGNLATIYKSIGDDNKALEYSEKALEITKKAYGEEHKETAKAYGNLASIYKSIGNDNKALEYSEKALEITKKAYGEKHKETAKAYGNLATIYKSIGDDDKALKYQMKALEITKKAYGEEHKETAKAYGNLATIYKSIGDDNKALKYQMKALEITKKAYGEEHKETAKAYGNLASIYRKKRDLKKALEYQLKALKGAKAGGNKKQIKINLQNLKMIYIGLKNWKKVKEIEKEIRKLEGKRKRF